MAEPPLLTLADIHLRLGDNVLFAGASLQLARGERACLVGRNGAGKSTLMKMMTGAIEPDAGERFVQPGVNLAYLPQEPDFGAAATVGDHVLEAGVAEHEAEAALTRVGLDPARPIASLSGGEARRASLAYAFALAPDILLLDEPTNHLDLAAIEWLERDLVERKGALLVVSHDRTFLTRVSNRVLWLDRRVLRRLDEGFAGFDAWQEQIAEAEARATEKLDAKLAAEARWLHRGVTARRRRNQGRLRRLHEMRAQRATLLGERSKAKFEAEDGALKSKLVIDAKDIAKSYPGPDGPVAVIERFSTRVLRGDRIGILGRNGAGKTTLLRMLAGDLEPDSGRVRLAKNLAVAYFDQHRAQLRRGDTLWQTMCPEGGDTVWVHGQARHVVAYLKDFLFDPKQANSPVSSLSGGERNRLLLAKILSKPSELLVLDEPTNDLDMDTLDMLEEMLGDYPGTLLVVSHDRDFLDRIVTSTIAVEGDGTAVEYAGGYSDYVAQRKRARRPANDDGGKRTGRAEPRGDRQSRPQTKLSYKDQRELDTLPRRIAALEREIGELEARLADADLYRRDPGGFAAATRRLAAARDELDGAETRWLELDALRESLARTG